MPHIQILFYMVLLTIKTRIAEYGFIIVLSLISLMPQVCFNKLTYLLT